MLVDPGGQNCTRCDLLSATPTTARSLGPHRTDAASDPVRTGPGGPLRSVSKSSSFSSDTRSAGADPRSPVRDFARTEARRMPRRPPGASPSRADASWSVAVAGRSWPPLRDQKSARPIKEFLSRSEFFDRSRGDTRSRAHPEAQHGHGHEFTGHDSEVGREQRGARCESFSRGPLFNARVSRLVTGERNAQEHLRKFFPCLHAHAERKRSDCEEKA
jgi:hypothetical protein